MVWELDNFRHKVTICAFMLHNVYNQRQEFINEDIAYLKKSKHKKL